MLAEQPCDILVVATHADSHLDYCELGATAGVPVIICEKPLAPSLREARKIAALTDSGRMKIVVNHERRYMADYRAAKEAASGGGLGALAAVRAEICMGTRVSVPDMLWHDGTHLFDALQFLTDRKLVLRKMLPKTHKNARVVYMYNDLLDSKSGPSVPCIIEADNKRDALVFEIELTLEHGRVRIGNGVFEIYETAPAPWAEGFRSLKKIKDNWEGGSGYFANMLDDAVACAREKEHKPISSAEDALSVVRYLEKIT
jgi:predicted dehydrogenase